MLSLTRQQRLALKRLYDRNPIWAKSITLTTCDSAYGVGKPLSYRQFRARIQPTYDGSGARIIHWCGMWLAIERDGHTHS